MALAFTSSSAIHGSLSSSSASSYEHPKGIPYLFLSKIQSLPYNVIIWSIVAPWFEFSRVLVSVLCIFFSLLFNKSFVFL